MSLYCAAVSEPGALAGICDVIKDCNWAGVIFVKARYETNFGPVRAGPALPDRSALWQDAQFVLYASKPDLASAAVYIPPDGQAAYAVDKVTLKKPTLNKALQM